MEIDYSELKEYITVNESDLASEWILQSGRVARMNEILANCRAVKAQKKCLYEEISAIEALSVREHPEKYGFDKFTETMISEYLAMNVKVKQAYKEYILACKDCDKVEGYVTASIDKRKCLENLTQLMVMGIYSEPKAKRVQ